MLPKEKAKELFDKFYDLPIIYAQAKDCALIAVDEILNDDWYITSFDEMIERKKYWEQVKQEIDNL